MQQLLESWGAWAALLGLAVLTCPGRASGDLIRSGYPYVPTPRGFETFYFIGDGTSVNSRDFTLSLRAVAGNQYDTRANLYGSVDIAMWQCFSGGFVDGVMRFYSKPLTFAGATEYQVTARSDRGWWQDTGVPNLPQKVYIIDNFVRAWRDAALKNTSMSDTFKNAAEGGNGVVPFKGSTRVWEGHAEKPQYGSSGPPSDTRKLGDEGQVKQFAIIAPTGMSGSWASPEVSKKEIDINIARIYQLLTEHYSVPKEQIAVLYPSANVSRLEADYAYPYKTGAFHPNLVESLPPVPVNGQMTWENWNKALRGDFFGSGARPDGNDKLFVFSMGHSASYGQYSIVITPIGNIIGLGGMDAGLAPLGAKALQYDVPIGSRFDVTNPDDPLLALNYTDWDRSDLLQLMFAEEVLGGITLSVNGQSFGPLSDYWIDPALARHFGDLLPGSYVSYQLRVPHELLGRDANFTHLVFGNVPANYIMPQLRGVYFEGGLQGYLAVEPFPEPGTLALLAVGVLTVLRLTRCRQAARHRP